MRYILILIDRNVMRRPARRVASIVDVRSGLHMGLYDHQYGTSTAESTLESK